MGFRRAGLGIGRKSLFTNNREGRVGRDAGSR